LIGVDHFFIIDDCSDDNQTAKVLQLYHDQHSILTRFKPSQLRHIYCKPHWRNEIAHYVFLLNIVRNHCTWVAQTDPDEYIFPTNDTETIRFLPSLLEGKEAPIRMPWYLMSTHGHEKRTAGLIIDRFTTGRINKHIKTFVKTNWVVKWNNSHHPFFYDPEFRYAESPFVHSWEVNFSQQCPLPQHSPLYIRHFSCMSWEEYMLFRGARNLTSGNHINVW